MLEFEEYKVKLNNKKPELTDLREAMHLREAEGEIEKLQAESTEPDYWNDSERSQRGQKRLRTLQNKCESYRKLETAWDDMMVICEMALEENDESMLEEYHLPRGSMQHVDLETGDEIWSKLKEYGVKYVPGGSAANTITCTSIFGMPSCYIGKIGNDELGHLYKSTLEQFGVKTILLEGTKGSGRAMCFITGANAERTFADYMGAALELVPEDLKPEYFEGYDYFHIEGYLVQNQDLIRKAVQMAKDAGCKISIDMASYNVVESNEAFFHNLVERYVDIVFANETEARAFPTRRSSDLFKGLRRSRLDNCGEGRRGCRDQDRCAALERRQGGDTATHRKRQSLRVC